MKLKAPPFWYRKTATPAPLQEKLLTPLSCLYRLGYELHQRTSSTETVNLPILCIGNINAGGTGKTPTALAVMDILRRQGIARNPFFLLRGYGGGAHGALRVDPSKHTAWDTGDEALILAKSAPTIICADRLQGAKLAMREGADLILMDDGLQNPGIYKDIKIVVVNGEMGFGNGKMIPAGPLRQPLEKGMKAADAFLMIGEDRRGTKSLLPANIPLFNAKLQQPEGNTLPAGPYIAFAGLGYPQKFFDFLRQDAGLEIVETVAFPDHYPYIKSDLLDLKEKADKVEARLITTEKDAMRLPSIEAIEVQTIPVRLHIDEEDAFAEFLKSRLV